MWSDNETDVDFLNFESVANSIAEIIDQSQGEPVSIGVSGAWGTGKSSLIKLTQASLRKHSHGRNGREFIFVEFNAWLYQGYDDARAALIDVLAEKLANEAKEHEKSIDKVKALLKRVNWFRAATVITGSAAAIATGLPTIGIFSELGKLGNFVTAGKINKIPTDGATNLESNEAHETSNGLLKPEMETSPPKEIHALRNAFEETLDELDVTLVVLVDDLDRCLPETTISTLEAIRLFLFLKNTAFVIAADDAMIKHAVCRHFKGVPDNSLVTNYFDKLIQVPIRVPTLGIQEVRGYIMMLFVMNSNLDADVKDKIRVGICDRLRQTWKGERVDRSFVQSLYKKCPPELIARFDTAERLAPMMSTASEIRGNPRLIKRFLNTLVIRMAISNSQGIGVDEAVLAKLMLFERLGNDKALADLIAKVNASETGKPSFMAEWEERAASDRNMNLPTPFNDPFFIEWLALPPTLADKDIRGALYVSREHAPRITPEERLSSEASELLTALLDTPSMAASLKDRLANLASTELNVIMDRILNDAQREQEWGVPPILEACLVVGAADNSQGIRLAGFLSERPPAQIKPDIIPKISDQVWAKNVFDIWDQKPVSDPVMRAIKTCRDNGNI